MKWKRSKKAAQEAKAKAAADKRARQQQRAGGGGGGGGGAAGAEDRNRKHSETTVPESADEVSAQHCQFPLSFTWPVWVHCGHKWMFFIFP